MSLRRFVGAAKARAVRCARPYRRVLVPLVAFLPAPVAYGLACLHGDWRYRRDAATREQIKHNLERVLGHELSGGERARVARDFFRLLSCEVVDKMRLAGSGRALARLVEIRGVEHIEAALMAGKGAILASAHFGAFDSGFSLIGARGFPITVVGRRPSGVDRRWSDWSALEWFFWRLTSQKPVAHHQRRPSIEPAGHESPRKGQLMVAVRAAAVLRQNELIGICIDVPVPAANRARAIPMAFLGGQALLLQGTTTLAQLTGAPVLMMFLRRSADWRHQVLDISPPVPLDGDAVAAFGRCLAALEAAVRRDPAHWFYWQRADLDAILTVPSPLPDPDEDRCRPA
jgi:lauroyl/myristoyl acyltransferase